MSLEFEMPRVKGQAEKLMAEMEAKGCGACPTVKGRAPITKYDRGRRALKAIIQAQNAYNRAWHTRGEQRERRFLGKAEELLAEARHELALAETTPEA